MLALATVVGKSFNGKFTTNVDFTVGYLMLPLLVLMSLHTLFGKYLDHILVKFEEDVSATETILA